jgi:mannosyl-oligosaccharide glucosidase
LDDYPRAKIVTELEGHVDLHSWLVYVTRHFSEFTKRLEIYIEQQKQKQQQQQQGFFSSSHLESLSASYSHISSQLNFYLHHFHYDASSHMMYDYYYSSAERGKNVSKKSTGNEPGQAQGQQQTKQQQKLKKHFVKHDGYVSLFPFVLRLLDPSHFPSDELTLQAVLSRLNSTSSLWSSHGILSLARSDPLFGTKENYWRGAIWINLNYLTVSALHYYAFEYPWSSLSPTPPSSSSPSGEQQQQHPLALLSSQLYSSLRSNLINTLYTQYVKTGYLWEQYDPKDGKGKRSHPFTGWTALIVLIMGEQY